MTNNANIIATDENGDPLPDALVEVNGIIPGGGGGSSGGATAAGYISGLLTEHVTVSEVAVHPGIAKSDSGAVDIDVETTLTADVSTTGAGGRQPGLAEQASAWYEIHVIAESDGSNPAAFLSAESQTLSLPSGYDTHRHVGYARNDGTSDFYMFIHQTPGAVYFGNPADHAALSSSAPATTFTNVDLTNVVPPNAQAVIVRIRSTGDGTAARHYLGLKHPAASGDHLIVRGWAGHGGADAETVDTVLVDSTPSIDYRTGNSASANIDVAGWVFYR